MPTQNLPDCFDCKYVGGDYPCRTANGRFDVAKVAEAIVAHGREYQHAVPMPQQVEENAIAWIIDCVFETIEDHPALLVPLIVAAMDACQTPDDAANVAAGLVEDSLIKHGRALVSDVEALAAASPKFSYILSGVWSRGGKIDADVWRRVGMAVAKHPRMSNDDRAPSDGSSAVVLGEAEATALMQERVTETARALGLIALP